MTARIPWLRILLLPAVLFTFGKSPIVRADNLTALEQKVHELVNDHRTAIGLEPLNYSEEIATIARRHSRDMATGYVGMGHEGADTRGHSLTKVITFTQFAENVGANNQNASSTPGMAVAGWLNSSGHRANIEGKFDLTGIGVADNGTTFFFTQIFLTTHSSRPPLETSRPRARTPVRSSSPKYERNDPPLRVRREYTPVRKQDEIDPRKRTGRKRVGGGWIQEVDPDY